MAEVLEHVTENFGFRLLSGSLGIKLFDEPVDFANPALANVPVSLLDTSSHLKLYAASNGSAIVVGQLHDLADHETAGSKTTRLELPDVTWLRFNCTSDSLYVVTKGQIVKASVGLVLAGSPLFEPIDSPGSVTVLEPALAPDSFAFLTAAQTLHIHKGPAQTKVDSVSAFSWLPDANSLAIVDGKSLKVVDVMGKTLHTYTSENLLLSVSSINQHQWYVTGKAAEDDEDLVHELVTLNGGVYGCNTIFMPPPFGEVARAPTVYCSTVKDWLPGSAFSFLAYSLSTEITTLQTGNQLQVVAQMNDTDRAELPMDSINDEDEDTLPVGLALDLTGTDRTVIAPSTAIEEANGVLPTLLCLNNVGKLLTWVVFDADGVNNKTASLTRAQAAEAPINASVPTVSAGSLAPTTDQSPAFKPAAGAFANLQTSKPPARPFGSPVTTENTPQAQAQPQNQTFGASAQPAFGQSSLGGSTFGQTSLGSSQSTMGNKLVPALSSLSGLSTFGKFGAKSAFGQSAGSGSPFAKLQGSTLSPFGLLALSGSSPFAKLNIDQGSIFGEKTLDEPPAFASSDSTLPQSATADNEIKSASGASASITGQSSATQGGSNSIFGQSSTLFAEPKPLFGQSSSGSNKPAFGQKVADLDDSKPKEPRNKFSSNYEPSEDESEGPTLEEDSENISDEDQNSSDNNNDPMLSQFREKISFFNSNAPSLRASSPQREPAATPTKPTLFGEKQPVFGAQVQDKPFALPIAAQSPNPDEKKKSITPESNSGKIQDLKAPSLFPSLNFGQGGESKLKPAEPLPLASKEELTLKAPFGAKSETLSVGLNEASSNKAEESGANGAQTQKAETSSLAATMEDASEQEEVKEKPKQDVMALLLETKLKMFDGYEPCAKDQNAVSEKIKHLSRMTDGQCEIMRQNAEILQKLMEAAQTKQVEDPVEQLGLALEWTLRDAVHLKGRAEELQLGLTSKLASSKVLAEQVQMLMDKVDRTSSLQEEIERTLGQISLYEQLRKKEAVDKQPLDIRAENLRRSLRQKFAKVSEQQTELEKEVSKLGYQLDLLYSRNNGTAKLDRAVFEVTTKTNMYSGQVANLEQEISRLRIDEPSDDGEEQKLLTYRGNSTALRAELAQRYQSSPQVRRINAVKLSPVKIN